MLVAGQSQSHKAELPASTKMAKPGGLLPRLIAFIVDSLILLVVLFPIMALWASQLTPGKVVAGTSSSPLDTVRGSLSLQLTLLLIQMFYFAGSWTIMAATPGQHLMSLRVTDANAAGIGFLRAILRYLLFSLFFVLAPVSALMVGLGKQKRALHDLLAGTYVIQIVDRDELAVEGGLPPSSSASQKPAAAVPAAAARTRPSVQPAEPAVAAAPAYSPPRATYSPPSSAPTYSASPGPTGPVPSARAAAPTPPPSIAPPPDFPPMPIGPPPEIPPPPGRPESGGGMDAELYAPPQMVDPPPPPPPHEHELPPMEFPPMAPPPDPHR